MQNLVLEICIMHKKGKNMRKWKVRLVSLLILLGVTACTIEKEETQFSEKILVSFTYISS